MKRILVFLVWMLSLQFSSGKDELAEAGAALRVEIFKFDFFADGGKWLKESPKYSDLKKSGKKIFTQKDITDFEVEDRELEKNEWHYRIVFTKTAETRLLELLRSGEIGWNNVILAIDGVPSEHHFSACRGCRGIDGILPSATLKSIKSRLKGDSAKEAEQAGGGSRGNGKD